MNNNLLLNLLISEEKLEKKTEAANFPFTFVSFWGK